MTTKAELLTLLDEADRLLGIAWGAHSKMRREGGGSNCRLSHEVRMFALDFSREQRDGPGELQVGGTGRFMKWRKAARAVSSPVLPRDKG